MSLSLYELSQTGQSLREMYLSEEIDENTYKDSLELLRAELEVNSNNVFKIMQEFDMLVGTSKREGAFKTERKRLKELEDKTNARYDKFKDRFRYIVFKKIKYNYST